MAWAYRPARRLRNLAPAFLTALAVFLGAALPGSAFFGAAAARAATTPPAVPRLLVLGDSLSAGYGLPADQGFEAQLAAALAGAGHPVHIVDGAVSGDTSAGGLARLDWVLAAGADAAIVELGANDGLRGLPTADLEKNLTAILDRLAARHVPVLLAGMLAPPNLGPQYGAAFRAVYAKLGARPGVIFYPFFLAGVAGNPALIQADGLHPNAAGVKIEVAHMLPDMLRLLAEVSARSGS